MQLWWNKKIFAKYNIYGLMTKIPTTHVCRLNLDNMTII